VVEEVNNTIPTTAEGARIFSPARQPPPGLSPNLDHPSFQPFMATGYYNGAGDSSIEEKQLWFNDLYSYEILPTSRPLHSLKSTVSLIELQNRSHKWDRHLEKQIIWRTVPFYSKAITIMNNMILGVLDDDEWKYYIKTHLSHHGTIPFQSTLRVISIPDHGEKLKGVIHRVCWKNGLPTLYNSFWYMKKWSQGIDRYRGRITSLALVRHFWTGPCGVYL